MAAETALETPLELRVASFADLDTSTLYALLRLRVDVFVVEQQCAYPELDGRDVEPGARHVWLARDRQIVGCLRILADSQRADADDPGVERIGRVAVAAGERGAGHARRLVAHALAVIGNRPTVLDAQAHLVDFYAALGFVATGPEYLDDGIAHVPMRRPAPAATDAAD